MEISHICKTLDPIGSTFSTYAEPSYQQFGEVPPPPSWSLSVFPMHY